VPVESVDPILLDFQVLAIVDYRSKTYFIRSGRSAKTEACSVVFGAKGMKFGVMVENETLK
jgi:hypothetical protein